MTEDIDVQKEVGGVAEGRLQPIISTSKIFF